MENNRSYPFEMIPCNLCGQLPRIHCHKDGAWSCSCPKKHGTDRRFDNKEDACLDWNADNIKHNRYYYGALSDVRASKECGRC